MRRRKVRHSRNLRLSEMIHLSGILSPHQHEDDRPEDERPPQEMGGEALSRPRPQPSETGLRRHPNNHSRLKAQPSPRKPWRRRRPGAPFPAPGIGLPARESFRDMPGVLQSRRLVAKPLSRKKAKDVLVDLDPVSGCGTRVPGAGPIRGRRSEERFARRVRHRRNARSARKTRVREPGSGGRRFSRHLAQRRRHIQGIRRSGTGSPGSGGPISERAKVGTFLSRASTERRNF